MTGLVTCIELTAPALAKGAIEGAQRPLHPDEIERCLDERLVYEVQEAFWRGIADAVTKGALIWMDGRLGLPDWEKS